MQGKYGPNWSKHRDQRKSELVVGRVLRVLLRVSLCFVGVESLRNPTLGKTWRRDVVSGHDSNLTLTPPS